MRHHILVIDDEQLIYDLLANFLTQHGFEVTTTKCKAEAVRSLDEHPYHLVLLDVVLKECDGLELLSEIKSAHPQLPVVL